MEFKYIDATACKGLLASGNVTLLDIRDPFAFENGHIDKAIHIDQIDVDSFIEEQPKDKPLVIYCYHGNASQSAAAFFADRGFTDVYSLDGGYDGWRRI